MHGGVSGAGGGGGESITYKREKGCARSGEKVKGSDPRYVLHLRRRLL